MKPLELLKYLFNLCTPEAKKDINPELMEILTRPEFHHIIPEINKFLIGENPLEDLQKNWGQMSGLMADYREEGISKEFLDREMQELRSRQKIIKDRCNKDAIIPNNILRDFEVFVDGNSR